MSGRKGAGPLGAALEGMVKAADAATAPRTWALRYQAPHVRGWVTWALIAGVPRDVSRDDVLAALEAWAQWPAWQARASIGGRFAVVEVTAKNAAKYGEGRPAPIAWATLAPATRRITVPIEGAAHARMTRAARAAGVTLTDWAARVLVEASDAAAAELGMAVGTIPGWVDQS